jgi:hypothetical protein
VVLNGSALRGKEDCCSSADRYIDNGPDR